VRRDYAPVCWSVDCKGVHAVAVVLLQQMTQYNCYNRPRRTDDTLDKKTAAGIGRRRALAASGLALVVLLGCCSGAIAKSDSGSTTAQSTASDQAQTQTDTGLGQVDQSLSQADQQLGEAAKAVSRARDALGGATARLRAHPVGNESQSVAAGSGDAQAALNKQAGNTGQDKQAAPKQSSGLDLPPDQPLPKLAQQALKDQGYYTAKVDGVIGPGTENALRDFQCQKGLDPNGKLDWQTVRELFGGGDRGQKQRETDQAKQSTEPSGSKDASKEQEQGSGSSSPPQSSPPQNSGSSTGDKRKSPSAFSPDGVEAAQPYSRSPGDDKVSVNRLISQKLYTTQGSTFGQVIDILLDTKTGQMTGAVVSGYDYSGHPTGKLVTVPIADLKLTKSGWLITDLGTQEASK
jgi:sporulation protein YlmC with PRC-barrel domain